MNSRRLHHVLIAIECDEVQARSLAMRCVGIAYTSGAVFHSMSLEQIPERGGDPVSLALVMPEQLAGTEKK